MRGIEGALLVLDEVEKGAFAAESLRRVWNEVSPPDRKLTATLVYVTLRRMGLWRHLLAKYCKRPLNSLHPTTLSVMTPGIAGVLELEHFKPGVLVNALVQRVKSIKDDSGESRGMRESRLVNAVLHTVMEKAPAYIASLLEAPTLQDQALALGVPGWAASVWSKEWGMKEAKRLLQLENEPVYLSLRTSPNLDREAWTSDYGNALSRPSELFESSIRIESNPYPPDLPGYANGLVTPQGESSMWAVESLLSHWQGGRLLDMCAGRGVKSGHILSYSPDARVEAWDISSARLKSAGRDLARLGVEERAEFVCGDALRLSPMERPSAILLDAPCSGSGTWGRHPEGKWRMSPIKLKKAAELQTRLFSRAADMLPAGGVIMYCTCSIFREENEKTVGGVLASRGDLVELPTRYRHLSSAFQSFQRKGKPYGTVVFPESPWVDGFYAVMFRKK
ncbi:MAG: RNA methyltransferase [Synergistaceae bacterium]|jgi:16S rRNA (cytosine967-C5)-methyltransferase|nr:RNA methyltransferase [Synergistaceae bacterium]